MISENLPNAAGRRRFSACAIHMYEEKVITPAFPCHFPGGKRARERGEKPLVVLTLHRAYKDILWVNGNKNCLPKVMGMIISMDGKYRL